MSLSGREGGSRPRSVDAAWGTADKARRVLEASRESEARRYLDDLDGMTTAVAHAANGPDAADKLKRLHVFAKEAIATFQPRVRNMVDYAEDDKARASVPYARNSRFGKPTESKSAEVRAVERFIEDVKLGLSIRPGPVLNAFGGMPRMDPVLLESENTRYCYAALDEANRLIDEHNRRTGTRYPLDPTAAVAAAAPAVPSAPVENRRNPFAERAAAATAAPAVPSAPVENRRYPFGYTPRSP